jgi:hypothetical protein
VLHRVDAHCSCPCQRRASLVPASVSCHARVCLGLCPQCPISFLCTTAIESQRIEAKGLSPTKTHREIFLESQPKIKGASNWGQNRCRLLVAHDRNPALINRTPPSPQRPRTHFSPLSLASASSTPPHHSATARAKATGQVASPRFVQHIFPAATTGGSLRITATCRLQTEMSCTAASPIRRLPHSKTDLGELPSSLWFCRKKPRQIPSTVERVRAPP